MCVGAMGSGSHRGSAEAEARIEGGKATDDADDDDENNDDNDNGWMDE